ncbi:MAG: UDP-2,3-diacylglucosamine diphosphatase [Candidatus Muproteobacteria bacterium RBG_16_64_11]|uniref:UDP-2,3-diacylglucosamine hydrolase n=1 Tax=Candidatus Muproteobacteria bacterium RBG_16_64_11 TaxID=1817758 RepID=A0A1F6TE61_9PROT|nr:MAG: UDP-2,3-diacylglucosamine diphosphatase [Candidatus Muproteobacteria bacterium RBG_16_64_11]
MATLFIADLHLSAHRPKIIALFLDFLRHRAARAEALYILGDLFEYWIGDDAAGQTENRPVVQGLRALTAGGVPVFVMHGNRDFLLGPTFESLTGCRLLADPARITLYGEEVLLMHGDNLCTDDVDYQKFRRLVRDPEWQRQLLGKSLEEREQIARSVRELSQAAMTGKPPEIMDVNPAAVAATIRQHGVRHLIHGHTHRPAQHEFLVDGKPARRTVLGDWYEQGSVLRCQAGHCALERFASA